MTEPKEPIEAVVARLREATKFEWPIVRPDDLARLLDHVEAFKWRPIESAPRDGTRVDLFADGERFPDCWFTSERWFSGIDGNTTLDSYPPVFEIIAPTLWMPIPPPPVNGEKG